MAIKGKKTSKRNTNPGVRVIGGRIYDSINGKSCHQCRQKTMDFGASCKVMKKKKLCPNYFCHKCLDNRYGEIAKEVAMLEDWKCPECRGICICSICRTSRGLEPTGILIYKAKACGFSSVFEFLQSEGPHNFGNQKKPKLDTASMEGTSGSCESVSKTDVNKVVDVVAKEKKKVVSKNAKATKKQKEQIEFEPEVPLPQGVLSTSVSGIDIPIEEAGNVYQLLEFCSAFEKVLDLKKGQAEDVVHELFVCGRNSKREQYCSIIEMMILLLDLISQDREISLSLSATDNSWFTTLGDILLQSEVSSNEFPPETFKAGVAEYKKMDASRRLKLLNLLCDESLNTWILRDYIKRKNEECEEQKKEAKQKAAAAKEKEKQLKQKMQDDFAKAISEKNGAPLSIEEQDSIMSQIRAESKQAHDEMMEAKGKTSGMTLSCEALRTDPIMLEDNGLVFWKLKYNEEEPVYLLQDLGRFDDLCSQEKWLAFKPEQKPEIEKYISSKKKKLIQTQKNVKKVENNANADSSESAPSPNSKLIISEQL